MLIFDRVLIFRPGAAKAAERGCPAEIEPDQRPDPNRRSAHGRRIDYFNSRGGPRNSTAAPGMSRQRRVLPPSSASIAA